MGKQLVVRSFSLSYDLSEKINEYCHINKLKVSEFIRNLVRKELEGEEDAISKR